MCCPRRRGRRDELARKHHQMIDIAYLALTAGLFVLSLCFVRLCQRV
jgi:hypothetical protein